MCLGNGADEIALAASVHERVEEGLLVSSGEQLVRLAFFHQLPAVYHEDAVTVRDRLQAMRHLYVIVVLL
mgnify:CR=1 FL=1